ncbi:MAG: PAS domain S-box protein [Candidatus Bathyarchaeota archaeon]
MVRQVSADKRRLAEEDVKTVKEDYLTIANLAGDLIVRIDKDGRFAFLNDAAIEFWGKPRKKLIGTNFVDYLYPEDKKKAVSTLQEMIKSKTLVKGFILRLKNPMGLRTVAWNVVPIFDESGDYVGTQATGKDLTELLRTEEELEQSRRQFHRLFELMVDPMAIIELNGNILEFSKSAEETTGFKREEIVGKHFLETIVGTLKTKAIMTRNLQKIKKGMHIPSHTVELATKDGRKLVCDLNLTKIMYRGEPAILAIFHDITGEKKAEETLRQEREVLEMITGNMNAGLVIVSKDYRVLWANKVLTKHLGDIEGEVCYSVLNQRTNICSGCGVKEIFETGKDWVVHEQVVPVPDGQKVWLEISASAIRDENGNIVAASEMSRDITERKRAEEKLRESEEKYRELLNGMNDTAWVIDFDCNSVDVNDAAVKVLGYSRKELLSMDIFGIDFSLDPEEIRGLVKGMPADEVQVFETAHTTKDGKTIPVEISSSLVTYQGKQAILSIARDITERKKAEEALRESEKRFRELSELLPEIVFETDTNGVLTFVNRAAFDQFGFSEQDFEKGLNLVEMLTPEAQERVRKNMGRVLSGEKLGAKEYTGVRKDGSTFPFLAHCSAIIKENKPVGVRGVIVDMTERKQMEDKILRQNEFLNSALDALTHPFYVIDADDYTIQLANSATGFGNLAENSTCYQVTHKRKKPCSAEHPCPLEIVKKTKKPAVLEHIHYDNDGNPRNVEVHGYPIFGNDGNVVQMIEYSLDITDRKEAEEGLRSSEERLKILFDFAPDAYYLNDLKGNFVDGNRAAEEITGYPREELIGKSFLSLKLLSKKQILKATKLLTKNLLGKPTGPDEFVLNRKDGTQIPIEIRTFPVKIKGQTLVLGIARDITERKKTELALKESLQKFRTIFEGATDGILAVDPETKKYVFANPRMYEISGYPFGELLKLGISDLHRKEDLPWIIEQFKKQLEGKLTLTRNLPVLRKDKEIVYCDVSSRLMKIGNQQCLVGFFRDITEQKKAEEKIQNLAKFPSENPNPVFRIAKDGTILYANKAAQTLRVKLGQKKKQFVPGILRQSVLGSLRSGLSEKVEVKYSDRIFSFVVAPVTEAGYVNIYGRDITERKKVQKAINKAMRLLKQSNEELESYTYVVSHDLKVPLRTIQSFGAFILEDYGDKLDETGQDYLNRMVNASSRMDSMIEDLLVLSRVGRKFTKFEKMDLNKLLEETLADIEMTIKERNAEIVVDKLPAITVQRMWMKQLFMNLIDNGLKFNESKTPKIEVLYQERKTDHLFKVRDNGIGIEKKYLKRIFNLFERASAQRKYKGTGAGLAICKKIVEQLEGKIWVESTPGEGSTFMFSIPKKIKQAEAA